MANPFGVGILKGEKAVKIYLFIIIMSFLAFSSSYTQSYSLLDAPYKMPVDTLAGTSTTTRDFYFNSGSDSTKAIRNPGSIDLDIYAEMQSTGAGGDTVYVEGYGIKIKKRTNSATIPDKEIGDRTFIGAITVPSGSNIFAEFKLDEVFGGMNAYDGLRLGFTLAGSDADTVRIWSGFRLPVMKIR